MQKVEPRTINIPQERIEIVSENSPEIDPNLNSLV